MNMLDFAKIIEIYLKDRKGLEIGGPSPAFQDIYPIVESLDNGLFSMQTVWGNTKEGQGTYEYTQSKLQGFTYISEAIYLKMIKNETYDFILASHVFEHIANPVKALLEWKRILKN